MAANASGSAATNALGDRFLTALTELDFVSMAACFSDDATFRALLPRGLQQAIGSDAVSHFQQWFGGADRIDLLKRESDNIAARQHLSWRMRVHGELGPRLIEQQAFATVDEDHFTRFDLLCTGFMPEADSTSQHTPEFAPGDVVVAAVLDGGEANCATLTPLIRARLREMSSGDVLEVVSNEPTAERDIDSWSRLTGNTLMGKRAVGGAMHFYIRKK